MPLRTRNRRAAMVAALALCSIPVLPAHAQGEDRACVDRIVETAVAPDGAAGKEQAALDALQYCKEEMAQPSGSVQQSTTAPVLAEYVIALPLVGPRGCLRMRWDGSLDSFSLVHDPLITDGFFLGNPYEAAVFYTKSQPNSRGIVSEYLGFTHDTWFLRMLEFQSPAGLPEERTFRGTAIGWTGWWTPWFECSQIVIEG